MVATEVVSLQLAGPADPEDKNSEWHRLLENGTKVLAKQPGYEGSWTGYNQDAKDKIQLFINWTSITDHENFTKTPDYGPTLTPLAALNVGDLKVVHVDFSSTSAQSTVFAAPVTEFVIAYARDKSSELETNFTKFVGIIEENARGFQGTVGGWIQEEVPYSGFEEGKLGRGYVMAVGWESVDAHTAFTKTEVFGKNVAMLEEHALGFTASHIKIVRER